MKSTLIGLWLLAAAAGPANTWRVEQGDVRVICPMTIGGSFEAKTSALSGTLTAIARGSQALEGSLAVDLRTLDSGIGLRNEHLRANYLEVGKGPGFDTATLSEINLTGVDADATEGKGSFTGQLTVHGLRKTVTGTVEVRRGGAGLHVKASFPVELADYNIRKPRYLGIGVTDTVQVVVGFDVQR
jgi:polyisoprenoid-binding protein YceI